MGPRQKRTLEGKSTSQLCGDRQLFTTVKHCGHLQLLPSFPLQTTYRGLGSPIPRSSFASQSVNVFFCQLQLQSRKKTVAAGRKRQKHTTKRRRPPGLTKVCQEWHKESGQRSPRRCTAHLALRRPTSLSYSAL